MDGYNSGEMKGARVARPVDRLGVRGAAVPYVREARRKNCCRGPGPFDSARPRPAGRSLPSGQPLRAAATSPFMVGQLDPPWFCLQFPARKTWE